MFTTPQKRGGASTLFGTPRNSTVVLPSTKGYFSDGTWHCNCEPRLPATKFQVKKETRNQGRWFYTCQVAKDDGGCGFFLWNEDAVTREGQAVLANSRSEVEKTPEANSSSGISRKKENYALGLGNDRTPTAGRESARTSHHVLVDLESEESEESEDGNEFGSWPLSPSTQKKVVERTDTQYTSTLSPETPRKASKMAPFTTPGSKRKRDNNYNSEPEESDDNAPSHYNLDEGLPTPITGGGAGGGRRMVSLSEYGNDDEDIFSTPSSLRTPSYHNSFGIRSPSITPTPFAGHFRASSPSPTRLLPDSSYVQPYSHSHLQARQDTHRDRDVTPILLSNPYDVTAEVLNLLQAEEVPLNEETKSRLKNLLGRHAMRVSGIAKGRDITRVALKGKDVRIGELGARIAAMETEREVDRRIIKGLREELGRR